MLMVIDDCSFSIIIGLLDVIFVMFWGDSSLFGQSAVHRVIERDCAVSAQKLNGY